jgi:ribonuclease P protein component
MGQANPEKTQSKGKEKADGVSYRFTKDERIRNRNDFLRIYAEGGRYVCPEFAGFHLKTGNALSRLGMSVGKKIGGSVVRNRLKRRIREIFRLHKHLLKPGYDIVINARKGDSSYSELKEAMLGFFTSAGLMAKRRLDDEPDST